MASFVTTLQKLGERPESDPSSPVVSGPANTVIPAGAANLDPAFLSEYGRVSAAGDSRSFDQWLYDHVTGTNDQNPGARSYLGLSSPAGDAPAPLDIPSFVADFFNGGTPTPSNADAGVPGDLSPVPLATSALAPPVDTSPDVLTQLQNFITGLFAVTGRPDTTTTIAPVTETYVDNRVNVTNKDTYNVGYSAGDVADLFSVFTGRITDLLSVPQGGSGSLPNLIPLGYAPNPDQSTQRRGNQTVASVTGLRSLLGTTPGSRLAPWMLVLALVSAGLALYLLFRKR